MVLFCTFYFPFCRICPRGWDWACFDDPLGPPLVILAGGGMNYAKDLLCNLPSFVVLKPSGLAFSMWT